MDFRCPICRSTAYQDLIKGERPTGLYTCRGCTVVFRDPDAFTAFDPNGLMAPQGTGGAHRR